MDCDRVTEASVALLLYDRRGGMSLGSAICLRLGEHTLLATAAHNLRQLRQLRPIPRGRYRGDPLRPLALGVGSAADGDVGWIELAGGAAARAGLHRLEPGDLFHGEIDERTPLLAHGYPAHGVDGKRLGGTRFDLVDARMLGHSVNGAAQRPDQLALSYRRPDASGALRPPGLSGGGMWCLGVGDEAPRLAGLARAWHPGAQVLLGTRIEAWLRVVAPDYPGAAAILEAALQRASPSRLG